MSRPNYALVVVSNLVVLALVVLMFVNGNRIAGLVVLALTVGGAFLPGLDTIVLLLRSEGERSRSSLVLANHVGNEFSKRTIFTGSGRLTGLTVAPNGRRILVGWPRADQWLFISTKRTNRIEAVGNIRRQFGVGPTGHFPRVEGWCCQARR